jgi:hypothetical protein
MRVDVLASLAVEGFLVLLTPFGPVSRILGVAADMGSR